MREQGTITTKKGDVIFSKSSWGRQQALGSFNIDILKANQPSIVVAKTVWTSEIIRYSFSIVQYVVDDILEAVQNQTSIGYDNYINMLREVWNAYGHKLEVDTYPEEGKLIRQLFNLLKKDCLPGAVIGKNAVQLNTLKHVLNLLDYL